MSTDKTAIVIVVDRLGCGQLGPYGNAWVSTPNWNQLASESLLCEFAIADSPKLDLVYRSYWQGLHAMRPSGLQQSCIAELLSETGVDVALVTDEQAVSEHPLADQISTITFCEPTLHTAPAVRPEDTQIARLFEAGIEQITKAEPPALVWIHAQGMQGRWDAPQQFRQQFADEDDPDPPDFTAPPNYLLNQDHDPDEIFGISNAYSGQMLLLDICLGAMMEQLARMPQHNDALIVVTSPRGFPLGEHLRIGACDDALYGELIHVPWLIRTTSSSESVRDHALVQPPDLHATLLDWFDIESPDAIDGQSLLASGHSAQTLPRQTACSFSGDQIAIRTPAWMLRRDDTNLELYVKPDDRWEVNNVAVRCTDIVDLLSETIDEYKLAAQTGCLNELRPLREVLIRGLD